MKTKPWYKLDNIGKFYSFTNNNVPIIFRYSVTLTEKVEKEKLQAALIETIQEFPSFNCTLKQGIFWYYLDYSEKPITVEEEKEPICSKIYKDNDDVLFRVNYYKNRINLEVSHIVSDGRGSLIFFKNIIYRYLKLKYNIKDLEPEELSSMYEKTEDSFEKYYTGPKTRKVPKKKVYHYHGRKKKETTFMEYHISTEKVHNLAKTYQVSITALLLAIWIESFYKQMREQDKTKTIKIDVPVDFRSIFKSSTSRNFFGITSVSYDVENNLDFNDLVTEVNRQLKENITKEQLRVRMNQMISLEKNIFIRFVPIIIKDFVLRTIDRIIYSTTTSSLSNIGKITVDKKIEKYIQNFNVLTTTKNQQLTICSYQDDLSIGISTKYINTDIIKNFCNFFQEHNIEGTMNINEVDQDEKM